MLEINNVSYKYKHTDWLFNQLNLTIEPGEIVGMYGRSGTGKTTLAKVITGYLQPMEGKILVDCKEKFFEKVNPIQLIWQHPEKTINPKWQLKKVLHEVEGLAEELIDILGINKDWLQRYPYELSGGELQRFCIARALGSETRYIVADEITSMFDSVTQAQIWHALITIVKEVKIGVLAISHNIKLLEKISDRIVDFNDITHANSSSHYHPFHLDAL